MSVLRPIQSLGQNFLQDPNVARKIVGAVRAPEAAHVVEIGPGTGALTGLLLDRYPKFTAIEIDDRAADHLEEEFPGIDVRRQDVLDVDWSALAAEKGSPVFVVGNLPYNITSQILFGLIEAPEVVREAVVMTQREVAERIVAEPRTKAYGILSVVLQLLAEPKLLFTVSRKVFYPRPDVTSAVVRLTIPPDQQRLGAARPDFLRNVVRTAFNQRRKMLRNSLGSYDIELPEDIGRKRAEELTPSEFVDLARYLEARS